MMRAALRKKFDVVLAESLDRFSRDQEDTAGLFKRLTFAGVNIVTLAEGDITHLHIGLKGTMNAMFLKELADKTRRGLRGRVELGKAGGGVCFGYRIVRRLRERRGDNGRTRDRARRSRDHSTDLQGLRGRGLTEADREGSEHRRRARSAGSALEPEHDPRQPEARHRHPPQRAVHRAHGLEPAAVPEGPGHRQTCRAAESAVRVDHQGRSRAAHHRRRGLAGGDRRGTRPFSGSGRRPRRAAIQPVPTTEVPVLGPDEVRRVRRRLHRLFPRAPRVLRRSGPRHLHQQADDLASGGRGARAPRACRTS